MLDEASGIDSVTLQDSAIQGWDDVVVRYSGQHPDKRLQVKHTRTDETLTFGDLVSTSGGSSSLLGALYQARHQCPEKQEWKGILYTNRSSGTIGAKTRSSGPSDGIYRPPLQDFWRHLETELGNGRSISDIEVPDGWSAAWDEWCSQLNGTEEENTAFLLAFEIRAGESGLGDLEAECKEELARIFGISLEDTGGLFSTLDHSLREWTTSRRESEYITREDAYEVLVESNQAQKTPYTVHTPRPFFPSRQHFAAQLEERLTSSNSKSVYFLSGDPGSGKSSLVSYLARRSEPTIDLRHYAFRPISPELPRIDPDANEAASSRSLWESLLQQLREPFAGRLSEAEVPVITHLMSPEELRDEVLRLATRLAKERQRDVIICIDGIDHAARAERNELPSLIDSLVPPDQVPDGIRFLLVGQPPEDYSEYPGWISGPGVWRVEIPPLEREDITELLEEKADQFAETTRAGLADTIENFANGNTLATVFAVEEACRVESSDELVKLLEEKELNSNISAYYEHIWKAVNRQHNVEQVAEIIAAALALSPSRVTGKMLASLFPDHDWRSLQWKKVLRDLGPLVVEDDHGFFVAHNDVRLFLEQKAKQSSSWYVDVASKMADYYMKYDDAPLHERHAALFRLLKLSNRDHELPQIFSPKWVIEAASLARPLHQVQKEAEEALDAAVSSRKWKSLIDALCGAHTVERWDACKDFVDVSPSNEVESLVPGLLVSEGEILPVADWEIEDLQRVVLDVATLLDANRKDRAVELLTAWFDRKTLSDVIDACDGVTVEPRHEARAEELEPSQDAKEFFEDLGKVAARSGHFPQFSEDPPEADYRRELESQFVAGALQGASTSADRWKSTVDLLPRLYFRPLFDACKRLHKRQQWDAVAYAIDRCPVERIRDLPGTFVAYGAFALLMTDQPQKAAPWVSTVEERGFNLIDNSGFPYDKLFDAVIISWVLGSQAPAHDSSTILRGSGPLSFVLNEQRPTAKKLLFASITSGRIWGARNDTDLSLSAAVPAHKLSRVLTPLFQTPPASAFPVGYPDLVNEVLRTLIPPVQQLSGQHGRVLGELAVDIAKDQPVDSRASSIWSILERRAQYGLLEEWARSWLPATGKLAELRFNERVDIADRLSSLCENQFPDLSKLFSNVANYSLLGYKDDDEYSLRSPLQWFRSLAELTPDVWEDRGLALLAISRGITDRAADNREANFVAATVAAQAAKLGPAPFLSFLEIVDPEEDADWLEDHSRAIRNSLTELVQQTDDIGFENAWAWWCLSTAVSRWFMQRDCYEMADLRNELQASLNDQELGSFEQLLSTCTPMESDTSEDPNQYTPPEFWGSETEEGDSLPSLATIDIPDALDILERSLDERALPAGVAAVAERLRKERPPDFQHSLKRLIKISGLYDVERRWSWSGSQRAAKAIIPLLDEATCWNLARKIREDADPRISLHTSIKNLSTLVRAVARGDNELLAYGFDSYLSMHQAWFTGAGVVCEAPELSAPTSAANSWTDVVISLSMKLLQADSSETVAAAMRGLNAYVTAQPDLIEKIWEQSGDNVQKWILLLLEKWALEHPQEVEPIVDKLVDSFQSLPLENRLQCWLVLNEVLDSHDLPDIFQPEKSAGQSILRPNKPLPDFQTATQGSVNYSWGNSMERERLKRLNRIFHIPTDAIESCMAVNQAWAANWQTKEPGLRRRGDSKWPEFTATAQFFKSLTEWAQTNAPDLPPIPTIQAVGYSDEPLFLATSPRPSKHDTWPQQQRGTQAPDPSKVREELLQVLTVEEKNDDEVVVAGKVVWYSRKMDYTLYYFFAEPDANTFPSFVPLGRSVLLREDNYYEPTIEIGQRSIATFSGGLHRFSHQTLEVLPTRLWRTNFGWEPSDHSPLIWSCDGTPVARYDRAAGPVRFNSGGPHHRSPRMHRWVVKRTALDKTGFCWTPKIDLDVQRFKDD